MTKAFGKIKRLAQKFPMSLNNGNKSKQGDNTTSIVDVLKPAVAVIVTSVEAMEPINKTFVTPNLSNANGTVETDGSYLAYSPSAPIATCIQDPPMHVASSLKWNHQLPSDG